MEYVCIERGSPNPDRRKLLQLKMKVISYIGEGNTQIELDAARATYRMITGDQPKPRQDPPLFSKKERMWGNFKCRELF
jgi:hypothetical protein